MKTIKQKIVSNLALLLMLWTAQTALAFYNPEIGRWANRDLIGERGGINLYAYVGNSPVNFVDAFGLDIWIEGPNSNEPNLHQSVNVGDPNGNYYSQSYGANGNWLQGEVYTDDQHGGQIQDYKKTTPEQDKEFEGKLKKELGPGGIYGVRDICRSYSQRKFKEAPGTPATPPARTPSQGPKPTLPSTTTRGTSTTGTGTSQ